MVIEKAVAAARVGMHPRTLDRIPGFPRPVRLAARKIGYLAAEVDEWLASRPRVERHSAKAAA
jgi:predicted DNA-binding transcriptional regulator AlpA